MTEFMTQFHLLRPGWLLAIVPALLAAALVWRQIQSGQGWSSVIHPSLLPHLLSGRGSKPARWPLLALLCAWCLAIFALAGPAWQQLPQPVERREDALVVLFDLSSSMYAEDVAPSRLIRSRQKLLDLLEQKTEGTTGLIAYAGDAHVVSPLTDDLRTVANLLPALTPDIMPVKGSRPAPAVAQAIRLLQDSGLERGQILLLTDGIRDGDSDAIADLLRGTGYRLHILGAGTAEGAPIPTDNGFLRDRDGNIVVAGLNRQPLNELARRFGGHYSDLQLGDADVERILRTDVWADLETERLLDRQVDAWQDMGFWLVLLLVPVALGAFRRGWLLGLVLLLPQPEPAQARDWQSLFLNRDQRATRMLEQGDAAAAADTFADPDWAATASYRAGDYEAALQRFQQLDDADSWYNRGNALARGGRLREAIAAYREALNRQGDMEDAAFNKALLEQLLEQQEQQQQQQNQQGEQQQDQQQQSGEDSRQQDQQSGNQQAQDQQSRDGAGQDQGENQPQQAAGEPSGESGDQSGDSQQRDQQAQRQQAAGQQPDEQAQQEAQRQAAEARGEESDGQPEQQASAANSAADLERDMANEQWLRRIPDDPSGLLRRKFHFESQQRANDIRDMDSRRDPDEPSW